NGRVRHPQLAGDQPRPPAGPPARLAHAVVDLVADAAGLAVRRRRAIVGPGARRALGRLGATVALDPVLHRRDAHASPGRGLATRETALQTELDELDALPSRQPPTLVLHPG